MAGLEGRLLDHYRLIEQIGQGGMATVLRGQDERDGSEVAVKVLSPTISGDRRFVRRFRREGGLVSRMRHPNIIPVTDYGQADGLVYLVMPFVRGDTLYDRYVRGGLTPQQAASWMSQIAEALHHAHEQGVIHRDIKPSNVMIDSDDQAHLADFGLARVVEGSSSLTGSMLMGTPAYMSPEQARGEKLDARSDQYSFAVILYQLFTGRLPFDGETPMQTAMMHLNDAVPPPRRFNPEISSALERVMVTALAKDRDARFPSVRALNTAFQAAIRGDSLEWLQPTLVFEPDKQASPQAPATPAPAAQPRLWPLALLALLAIGSAVAALAFVPNLRQVLGISRLPQVAAATEAPTAAPTNPPPTEAPTALPTPVPPVESASCPGLSIIGFNTSGNSATWQIDNGLSQALELEELLSFSAPLTNQSVEQIRLGEQVIFEGPATEGTFNWLDTANRTIAAGEVKALEIVFAWEAEPEGYGMNMVFSGNCSIEGSW